LKNFIALSTFVALINPVITSTMSKLSLSPTSEEIAAYAYELWKTAGCPHGSDIQNWLQAERELTIAYKNNGSVSSKSEIKSSDSTSKAKANTPASRPQANNRSSARVNA
jgi:hypothetical protein